MAEYYEKQIDWKRTLLSKASRSLRFPDKCFIAEGKSRRSVSGIAVRSVLNVIEDHAGPFRWCFVSNATLAGEANTNKTDARRALTYIENEGLIIRQLVPKSVNVTGRRMRPHLDQYLESKLSLLSADDRQLLRQKLQQAAKDSGVRNGTEIESRSAPIRERSAPIRERSAPIQERSAPPGGAGKYSVRSSSESYRSEVPRARAPDRTIGLRFSDPEVDRALDWIQELVNLIDLERTGIEHKGGDDNWTAIAKICVLSAAEDATGWPEHWIRDAIESIKWNRSQGETVGVGYLIAVCRKHCEQAGKNIGREFARTTIPLEVQGC